MKYTVEETKGGCTTMLGDLQREIDEELERIGVTYDACGPCESIVASIDDDGLQVTFSDDYASVTYPVRHVLSKLREIPTDAGTGTFWERM